MAIFNKIWITLLIILIVYVLSWLALYRIFGIKYNGWPAIKNGVSGNMVVHSTAFDEHGYIRLSVYCDRIFGIIHGLFDFNNFTPSPDRADDVAMLRTAGITKDRGTYIYVVRHATFYVSEYHWYCGFTYCGYTPYQFNKPKN